MKSGIKPLVNTCKSQVELLKSLDLAIFDILFVVFFNVSNGALSAKRIRNI